MKSFPSTANEAQAMYGSRKSQSYSQTFDVERIKALNLNTSIPVIKEQLKDVNINASNFQRYPAMSRLFYNSFNGTTSSSESQMQSYNSRVFYENPLELPAEIIALAKDYDWIYKYRVNSVVSTERAGNNSLKANLTSTMIVPSMFNPMFGVSAQGIIRNTPLLNDFEEDEYDSNIDDCSIRTLCSLSKMANSPIGAHRYKYADFMYCKDLGKVSNNHLITLRKFAHPVPDHIGRGTIPRYMVEGDDWQWEIEGDVGRMVTWFDTDDNRIEDIAKFSYEASWKKLEAEIETDETNRADNPNTGIIGMLSTSLNLSYNKAVGAGQAGNHSILTWLGSQMCPSVMQGIGSNNQLLRNYDNYKVYTPQNTMQYNHVYEGKLEFSHEFTLNFSYELRAYDNINPRSAFMDLIGNILEVTYRRGKFWGGSRKIIGPAQDMSMFNKVHHFVDGTIDQIPGFLSSLAQGGLNLNNFLGTLTSKANELLGDIQNTFENGFVDGIKNVASGVGSYFKDLATRAGFTEAVKGMVKNALGRPQMYAWHSLVSGDDVGLWHVTVGNPKNPILSIGNLILKNAEIKHMGPLGVDDFPTQLKVSVTLMHPRPRDITDIGRMYTGGTNAIYHVLAGHNVEDFYSSSKSTASIKPGDTTVASTNNVSKTNSSDSQISQLKKQAKKDTQDMALRHKGESITKFIPTTSNGLPNPFLNTEEAITLARKNTWSDAIFTLMMQEVA